MMATSRGPRAELGSPRGRLATTAIARRCATLSLGVLALAGCGREVPAGGVKSEDAPVSRDLKVSRRVEPEELFPRDLDLCVRVDLARLKESLGPTSRDLLGQLGDEPLLGKAIAKARSVTFALRVSDLEVGDRVVAVEGDLAGLIPDGDVYREEKTSNDRVRLFERRSEGARGDTAAIVVLDERALVFVSSVEVDAVRRVLAKGPDADRPDPSAEGVMSLHYKPRRLARSLEEKYPSVGKLIAQLGDVRGSANVPDEGVVVDLIIVAKSEEGATRAAKFVDILRSNTEDEGISKLLRGVDTELNGTALHVHWVIPSDVVLAALAKGKKAATDGASDSKSRLEAPRGD